MTSGLRYPEPFVKDARSGRTEMIRKAAKYVLMVAIGAAPVMLPAAAHAQWDWGQNNHDRDADKDYRQGYEHGRRDAERGRQGRPDNNERSFQRGYWEGYRSVRTNGNNRGGYYGNNGGYYGNNGYGNNGYGNNGAYGNNGNGMNNAQQVGFQDGVNDGN